MKHKDIRGWEVGSWNGVGSGELTEQAEPLTAYPLNSFCLHEHWSMKRAIRQKQDHLVLLLVAKRWIIPHNNGPKDCLDQFQSRAARNRSVSCPSETVALHPIVHTWTHGHTGTMFLTLIQTVNARFLVLFGHPGAHKGVEPASLRLNPEPNLSLNLQTGTTERSVLSGVVALAVAASVSKEGAKESECLLFVSSVSKPPTIFFLLINLLTPPYCLRCGA
ncbi:hypothetical protein JOQ06_009345, partial [Pogonophryne albipinna]